MFIDNKLFVLFCAFLLFQFAQCRKKRQMKEMEYSIHNFSSSEIDFLKLDYDGSSTKRSKSRVWKWKKDTPQISIEIPPNAFNSVTNKASNGSFSLELDAKIQKRSKMSAVRFRCQKPDGSEGLCLEILFYLKRSEISLHYWNADSLPELVRFKSGKLTTKKWWNFKFHIDTNASFIGISTDLGKKSGIYVAKGVKFNLQSITSIQVCGRTQRHRFLGQIRKLSMYVPGLVSFSDPSETQPLEPASQEKSSRNALTKRGALRPMEPGGNLAARSEIRETLRTPTLDALRSTNNIDATVDQKVQRCLDENQSLNVMITQLRQSLAQVEQRLTNLESCECVPVRCIDASGVFHSNDEEWMEGRCTTCVCRQGQVHCHNISGCQENPGFCASEPCQNNAQCEELEDGYRCRCLDGFHGPECQHTDSCDLNVCRNGGSCVHEASSYRCECPKPYRGTHCELTDWCRRRPCLNGVCTNTKYSRSCDCQDGYIGDSCQYGDPCYSSPCMNGAICTPFFGSRLRFMCACVTGYKGERCEQLDHCATEPCLNGGECQNRGQSFVCRCPNGFTGPRCDLVDACAEEPCMNGARCHNDDDGFHCTCVGHYTGSLCETLDACRVSPCLNGGRCTPNDDVTQGGFSCACPPTHTGPLCDTIDHCSSTPCMNGAQCSNTDSGFSCRCRGSHFGARCERSNYCRANPCRHNAICSNTPLNDQQPFTCTCPDGFTGVICELADRCASNPCLHRGVCSNEGDGYHCACTPPYSGQRCETYDYCHRQPCLNEGRCTNKIVGFECKCLEAFTGDRCQNTHPCSANPCRNNGICTMVDEGYTCECPPTHYGPHCRLTNACHVNPCQNGGICINDNQGYRCDCLGGFYGDDCSSRNLCRADYCLNGGVCTSQDGGPKCTCPPTHKGPRCGSLCNICLYASDAGQTCARDQVPFAGAGPRWFHDRFTGACRQFNYRGCEGNMNNFATRQECRQRCIVGACCMKQRGSSQTVCRTKSLSQCKRINVERGSRYQVIGFKAGEACSASICANDKTCKIGAEEYTVGSTVRLGCSETCNCIAGGILQCACSTPSQRKEIRKFLPDELTDFVSAVRSLKTTELEDMSNAWDAIRDDYIQHSPIAQSGAHFLAWNRAFLRRVEMALRENNCKATIPYFDFTLDAGNFSNSVLWQPNYFGGEGNCIPDHPFRIFHNYRGVPWQPCLVRHFNTSVPVPSMVDVAIAMKATTQAQLSRQLLEIVSYVRSYIGGDMATTGAAYDPVFYPIHAYIDHLFSEWQKLNPQQADADLGKVPLGFPLDYVWSGACAEYLAAHQVTSQCNVTGSAPQVFTSNGYNLNGFNPSGFNRLGYDQRGYNVLGRDRYGRKDSRSIYLQGGYSAEGYNRAGLDRRGCNEYGFCDGYNRDGFNALGYNRQGYDRYGLNADRYDMNGFDIYGVSKSGKVDDVNFDETGFNDCCFSRDGFAVTGLDRFGFSAAGYDENQCNYYFHGPHVFYYRKKLWEILKVQPTSFLASLQRNCGPLADLPGSYLQSNWNAQLTTSTQATQASTNAHNSTCAFTKRFCFDVDSLMTWCPCLEGNYPAVCHMNPCEDNRCELHPQARCHVNFCGQTCSAEFYLRGRRVKCDNPCLSSPCLNGGTCVASQFYSASERFTCKCMSQYSGPLCERQAVDTCSLPMIVGNCNATNRRWHFDHISGACNSFTYSGCGGNLNNFPNKNACELRCSVGACCYRKISNISSLIGFDHDGYDKYGFTMYGVDRNGKKRSPHNSLPHSNNILGLKGFGHDGYNIHGYNEAGFDRQGYDRDGYHGVTGYNRTGYDRNGVYDQLTGFDRDGYDINGFDRSGFKCNGLNREGYNRLGFYEKFEYNCQSMSIERCDSIEKPFEVVAFSPGVTCDEVNCQDRCGCEMNGKTYRLGEKFSYSCQICQCTLAGTIDCTCKKMGKRKEIRDLTEGERFKYQDAVRRVYESGEWDYFVSIHSQFMKVANGGTLALPWHRYFLSNVERMLQQESDCDLSIPYFDWTIDVGSLEQSSAWNVRYFGGNGKGESNCVRYHSFGDAETWHPCIRRNFNTSVSLPNAVDFQLLLREHDYDAFRIQLETMSALFHLWVGGHMASPFSPYDPLYFSHWAFMDLIWSDWQKRSPDGMSRFPLSHRYVQFEPFDVTPDDVISSQQQSCVVYIPPTIGSACNSTTQTPNLGRNGDGFDRHGYDVNGFDIEGFDKNGQDRRGNPDERGVYDSNGFLGSGYARDGFDPQGWDRFGFRRNNFNRDGIDIEGYDRSGYDQFGFNRSKVTPFGMFKNESLAPRVDAGYVATLFDRYGYDKYGFNKHGLDYNGYSAFGYNHHGLDRDRCNYFLHGPHYMRQFYMTLMQLRNLQPADLGRVKRICEPVSLLPRWMAQGWLGDWETVLRYQKTWSNKHQSDPNWKERTSSVTEEGLWLPITPDKQFCFDMQAYSGCPVGTTLVDCEEDVCMKSRCASNPHAECRTRNCGSCYPEYYNGATGEVITCFGCIDMQGKIYSEASSWDTRCDSCLCQGGMIACHPKPCPTPLCPHPSTRPGQCCPVCQDCEFEERTYRNGQRFKHGRCETCRCVRGSVTCRSVATNCPPTPCTNPVRRAGDCCLVCPENSCGDHREGEQWSSDCDNCQCIDNRAVCAKLSCAAAPCSNPRTPRGACCPTCVGCSYNGRSLNNGQRFTEGCMQCSCRFGNVQCVHQHCPRLSCQNQVTAVGSCCPVCQPGCEHGGQFYKNGQSFRPTESACRNCTCMDNEVTCHGRACRAASSCPRPERGNGSCCPTCGGCRYGEHFYRQHQAWTSDDGCQRCTCESGNIDCRMIAPCGSTCTHGARTPGRCCPDCSRCAYHSRSYRDGERFVSDRDPCRSCVCKRGSVTCEVTRCPKLKCSNTHRPRDQCCPVCAPCYHGNKEWAHGSSWRLPSDPCSSCACAEGSIRCEKETCPSLSCEHPVNIDSSCCQSCDGCFYNGMTYANQAVVHSSNTCQHCQCVDGTVTCTMEHCPELSCSSHVTLPGQCCPRCSSCSHEGGNYDEGATFISRRNPCLECTCESGETDCRRIDLDCPSVTSLCRHPGRDRDECCPRCDLCEYERRNYRNGQRFHPPHASQCVSCVCTNGTVECDTEVCKSMSCSNPVVKADQCCPVCQECEADGRSHQSGDVWFQGKCTRCECVDGVTQCVDVPCPQLNCTHPVTTAQSCCSTCDMCLFDGRVFANHRQFAHPNQPCETCTCQAGSVSCQTRDCPSLSCPHPVTSLDACCPTCPTDCRVSPTLVLGSGESRTMPEDQCRTCTCTAGELRCTRRCLTTVPCSHPTDGACCRDNCDGCFYRGKHMDNGQVQPHSRNPCRTCTCVNGNVRCSRKKCQAVTCRQPAMDEDGCCPVCPKKQRSCEHGGQTRRHNVQFAEDCKLCRCEDGEVTCRPKSCPAFHCSHPVVRNCCRHCGGCLVGASEYQSGEEVTGFSSDVCQTCRCVSGSVVCSPRTCPNPTCTHPVKDPNGCCSVCNDCMYEGRRYDQGSLFNPPNDNCEECECNEGSVTCQRELCFDVTCPHAVTQPGSCCPSCGDSCSYEGEMFSNMQTFPDPSSECRTCTCDAGFVACSAKRCPPASCSNPVQGECNCSKCDDCLYNGVRRRNRETFSNPQDQQCSECYCQDGSVVCGARHCQPSTCTHPIDDPCMCPLCTKCLYFGSTYDHGDTFPDVEHSCNECTCQDGNVRCARRECPPVACQHPVIETCGCPQCTSCNYMGVEFNHLQEFPDSMNKCNKCICKSGSVRCTLVRCPATQCSKPATPIGECCPKCIGSCMADGRSYENGASFVSPLDVCSTCLCSFGSISCVREQCSRTCSHPLSTTQCCADCSGCLYQNRRFDDGLTFMHPSDLCQRCICTQGSVVCHNMHCPPLNCTNPNTVPGQCCKQCPQALSFGGCMHNGQEKEIGNRWMERDEDSCRECRCDRYGTTRCSEATCTNSCSHPVPSLDQCCPTCHHCFYGNRTRDHGKMFRPDGCHECVCKKGNVRCVTKACRPLPCPARKQAVPDGLCCPECMSCSADGKLYLDGQQWHLPDEPCVTCQCQHGIVTCRRVTCVSACHFTAPVPGQCCPVCVGCNLRGRTHEVGVPFEPNPMDPCEKCQCVVASDGSRGLACTRAPCPSLADCPRSCVRQPAPGSCCPYCSSDCSYGNCRSTIAGQEINPSDDPCFSCECNVNNTWICAPLVCPVLSCPTSVQYTPKGSCCAVCDTCHLPLENKQVASGDTWSVDECRSCSCDRGTTRCEEQRCVTLTCGRDKVPYKQAGKCCEECVDPSADCVYEGHVVSPRRRWLVDKCTTCHCFAGKVNCVTKRCRMLMCNSDQVATVMPGECCPQCRPRPGQCVAFGDPHYRTFDGRMIHFQGKCKYVLAADCMHQDFRIEVKNTDHGGSFGGVSWTDEVFINVAGSRVVLDKQYRVSINGTSIKHLPFLVKPQLLIHRSGNHLIVNSEIGVYVSWNAQQSRLEVSVPGSYKRRTCGLCGNFNNFPQDDLRLRSTHIAASDLAFGNDWKVRDPTSGRCPDAVAYDPCQAVTYAQRKMANKACKVITSQTFSACHQVVSPGMYFASCVYDACACGQNDQFCVCNAVEAYAAQCRRSGVVVQWRTAHMCQIRCPVDKGYVFDECGSPCKRTCANRNLPPQVIEAQCYQPCVSGCACPAGKVEHQGRCIAPRDCPDNIAAVAVNE